MSHQLTISPHIIEGLYCEALVLTDEVRAVFDLSKRESTEAADEDLARLSLSCEALRTTTRMMHALAWLLNHRACFMGELSEFQLRRHCRLAADYPPADQERLNLLEPEIRALIAETERFYARLVRLDRNWRERDPHAPSEVAVLRARLGKAMHARS
jgi:regulator of CtrA degradation